jgi:hypothetical protein
MWCDYHKQIPTIIVIVKQPELGLAITAVLPIIARIAKINLDIRTTLEAKLKTQITTALINAKKLISILNPRRRKLKPM